MPRRTITITLILTLFILVACSDDEASTPVGVPDVLSTAAPVESGGGGEEMPVEVTAAAPTAIPPTPTPTEPLAAMVNGNPLFLIDYEKELARYEQAQSDLGLNGGEDQDGYRLTVLNALIETELIIQAAAGLGLSVSDEAVDQRLTELQDSSGGAENFTAWLGANQWTLEEFRQALSVEMLIEQTVGLITADVPFAVEQIHARYLQVDDEALARSVLGQLQAGGDFALLARQHSLDRLTGEAGGDLGFFAAGTLLVPEIEAAAFALAPGEFSDIIQASRADGSGTTYYLVQVIERDPERQLSADLRSTMLQEKFEAWLAELWAQADVVRLVDVGT